MPADGASGAALGIGVKSGLFAGLIAGFIAVLSVVLGFKVVPLAKGREHEDAANRLAAGLLCSFTLGPMAAFLAIDHWPWLMAPWQRMLAGQHILWQYLAAATPFIALTAVLGFWIVAAVMLWLSKRAGKDIAELARDAMSDVRSVVGGGGGGEPRP